MGHRFYFYPGLAADVINAYSRSSHILVSFSIGNLSAGFDVIHNKDMFLEDTFSGCVKNVFVRSVRRYTNVLQKS